MAKKIKQEGEEVFNAFQNEKVKVQDPSHLEPQKETDGPPPRPEVKDPKHLKPQE